LVFPNEDGCLEYEADHPHFGIGLGLYMYDASAPKCGLMSGACAASFFFPEIAHIYIVPRETEAMMHEILRERGRQLPTDA
jgi:hypothetical protein